MNSCDIKISRRIMANGVHEKEEKDIRILKRALTF